jgi:transmembrane sensor
MNTVGLAAEWFTRLRDRPLTIQESRLFSDWLAESPQNIREYLAVIETWGQLKSAVEWPPDSKESLLAILRQAKDDNVYSIKVPHRGRLDDTVTRMGPHRSRRRRLIMAVLAASVASLLVIVELVQGSGVYRTARGEQRSIVLTDGSVIQLNTLSELTVHFDRSSRRVELSQGEAYFRVAHDKSRPFMVETPYAAVRAVGTEFDVYNRHDTTRIAVVEGKITVAAANVEHISTAPSTEPRQLGLASDAKSSSMRIKSASVVRLSAGQQITVSQATVLAPVVVNTTSSTAWIQRRIVLDNDTVAEAADQFNRYNKTQIIVDNAGLARLHISGVFNADDPAALVNYLREMQGVRVTEQSHRVILSR